jgi:hypothetical protein
MPVGGVLDLSPLVDSQTTSASVYAPQIDPAVMSRVMLSPNLVFESSRSTLADPPTTGPANPGPLAPNLPDALGLPVSIAMSSALISFLQAHGSAVVAPVISRLWCPSAIDCPQASWVERAILLTQATATAGQDVAHGPMPTALIAMRSIGLASQSLPLVVEQSTERGHYRVRFSHGRDDRSLCPDLAFSRPAFSISAEVIALPSGTVAARIHETRPVSVRGELTARVTVNDWRAVEGSRYVGEERVTYVERYDMVPLLCSGVDEALRQLRSRAVDTVSGATVQEMLRAALEPLYARGPRS